MPYKVKLDIFEGPFDLLVYLIERAGVSIYDVNISEITDQYIDYVRNMKKLTPQSAAEFMVLAATLIQIKSRMLLPGAAAEPGQEEDDPRDELADKIMEYKKYRYLAGRLRSELDSGARYFTKPREDITQYTDEPVEYIEMDLDRFIGAFRLFLEKRSREADVRRRYEFVERERMTMETKSQQMIARLKNKGTMTLAELAGDGTDRYELVLTFVTVLEMVRNSLVNVRQGGLFDDIFVELREEADSYAERKDDHESL